MSAKAPEAINIQLAGVGGQGVLLISNIIGLACVKHGLNVLSSEIHGMAQRGGVVWSTVRIGEVFSPMIAAGEADVLLAFEPVEAARAAEVVSKRTVVIINLRAIVPFTVGTWGHKYPPVDDMIKALKGISKKVVAVDAEKLAEKAGNKVAMNVVMLGALMGRGVLPVPDHIMKAAMSEKVPKKAVDLNMKAYDLGFKEAKITRG
jgi:indolepyruvate ferredoxin oxidoreductase beta subunit